MNENNFQFSAPKMNKLLITLENFTRLFVFPHNIPLFSHRFPTIQFPLILLDLSTNQSRCKPCYTKYKIEVTNKIRYNDRKSRTKQPNLNYLVCEITKFVNCKYTVDNDHKSIFTIFYYILIIIDNTWYKYVRVIIFFLPNIRFNNKTKIASYNFSVLFSWNKI